MDGSEPDANSTIYNGLTPITLTQSTTLKAKVFRAGSDPSDTATADYTVVPAASVPIINPNGGDHTGSVQVGLSLPPKSTNKGMNLEDFIYYTNNGADPQPFSNLYTAPFTLGVGNHVVKARTIFPGLAASAIAEARFTVFTPAITLDPPTFRPLARDHTNSVEVLIDHFTVDAKIFYTVANGLQPPDPTDSSNLYEGPFTLGVPPGTDSFYFLKAKAFKDENESAVSVKTFSVFEPLGTIEAPVFDPPGGETYDNPITVNMSATSSSGTGGIGIFRTTNGDTPFVPDPPIGGNVRDVDINRDTELKAIAYRSVFGQSSVTSATYLFKCAATTIEAANSKQIAATGSIAIIMSSTTTGGNTRIRYEMGGLVPDETSTEYTEPLTLGIGTHVLKAKTFRLNFADSDTTTASFVVSETPEAPIILTHPISATIDAFSDHTFMSEAIGTPDPEFSWYFQAASATQAARLASETDPNLALFNVQSANAGDYFVVASNPAGSATSTLAFLTLNEFDTPTPSPTNTVDLNATATPSSTNTMDVTSTPTQTTPTPRDLDCDSSGVIDAIDLLCLLEEWHQPANGNPVGEFDLLELAEKWME